MAPQDHLASVDSADPPRGFRHYNLPGLGHPPVPADRTDVAVRAARLELRMNAEMSWDGVPAVLADAGEAVDKPGLDIHDNPYIPSGYTYLSQFVAHDMVATRLPLWATARPDRETSNDRASRLRLDALYGAGPTGVPIIYEASDPNDLSRAKLRIGRAGSLTPAQEGGLCPYRDIARLRPPGADPAVVGLTEPLVADPRNDDHAIISQLTMVFSHLHNVFVDRQTPVPPDATTFDFTRQTADLFARARTATTLVYRRLIRDDLMKRLLHPAVYAYYTSGNPRFLDLDAGDDRAGVPLEFSHAAFRFGHAMVRDRYHVNQMAADPEDLPMNQALEHFSSGRNVRMTPMDRKWVVLWSNFFHVAGLSDKRYVNLSRRIGPRSPTSLFGRDLGPIDASQGRGLFYRDLISAELANLWGVPTLLDVLRKHDGLSALIGDSDFLRDGTWQAAIRDWLAEDVSISPTPWGDVSDAAKRADVDAISSEPPLPFFVLFEAFKDSQSAGFRLGRLGSVLVADTIFGELSNPLDAESASETLDGQLRALCPAFEDPAFGQTLTMGSVIGFINATLQQHADDAMKLPALL